MGVRTATVGDNFTQEEPSQVERVRDETNRMPRGIPYIIGNEAAERFSYYGMRTILVIFMTKFLMDKTGALNPMSEVQASTWYHLFTTANYFFPMLGALVADIFWGKYKTILRLSIVYCLGHLMLAIGDSHFGIHVLGMRTCLGLGLAMIAIGSGGIKPVVSSHVGDQFTAKNKNLIEKVFSVFYFAINLGAFLSTLLTPVLLVAYGPGVAFGLPGVLMFIATVVFKMGDKVYVAIPPAGWQTYKKDVFSAKGKKVLLNLSIMYLFVSMFWALFDQSGSSWVMQAERMDRLVDLRFWIFQFDWLRFEILSSQLQAINPIMVLALIPIFSGIVYPTVSKVYKMTPMRKMAIGMLVAAFSFALIAMAQSRISAGANVSMMWQFWAYLVITIAEVMVSITGLEFSYTQAPNTMKSIVMGLWLLAVSMGNLFTAWVDHVVEDVNVWLPWTNLVTKSAEGMSQFSANYFWLFTILMGITGITFALISSRYREESYIQSHAGLRH